ncbi:FecR family protein, partial [Arachidicoccus sp.]|uniref:FecR family protein n=1 Tax=Arachidicoccus sp. TaxID=1872624 RepID=UPI003D2632CA
MQADMIITKDVIERFFTGTCSDQEREEVARYFKEYPMEADRYFPELDWNDTSRWNEPLDDSVSNRMLDKIHSTLAEKKNRRRSLYYKISSIAAIFLLLVGIFYFEHSQDSPTQKTVVSRPLKVITHSNKGIAVEHLILPDSTTVELYPHSTISYLAHFEATKRDMQLKGEALFKVFKDAQRPFTVYSEQVSTTALGTCFLVKISSREINIRLYEGKVLVRKIDGLAKELNIHNNKFVVVKDSSNYNRNEYKRYYLNAGNEIVYHVFSDQFSPILNFLKPEDKKPLIVVSQNNKP